MATYDPRTIAIGVLGKPHGVRGEIGLRLFNPGSPASLANLPSLVLERQGKTATHVLTASRPFGEGFLVTLQGIGSREQAAALTHSQVLVDRAALPPPAPGEYFVSDVVGCQVFTMEGTRLGVVRETFWNGAHDVMIVDGDAIDDGQAPEHLIPLVADFIREVDCSGRSIKIEWHGP
jgi:16S rRNA processing protein RimM